MRCCLDARTWESNSVHIPPFAAGELEVVAGAVTETELVAELVLGSGAGTEVWFTDCISVISLFFIGSTFAMSRNPKFLNLGSRNVLTARP